ncbi:MAG: SMP-30/gluconolactonase/LRE family protein [Actinobacteria bacterium]|nr:SMP-30/gluconolactonase/LRE family protein [Actinomycetota bacterium]
MNLDTVAEGLHYGEGPRWHHGKLWFSDFYDHAVKTVDADGNVDTKLIVPEQPSGLGWLPDGRLLVVSMLDLRILRLEDDELVVHAELSTIAEFHCNDMVVDAFGRAYVGNFGFDLAAAEHSGAFGEALKAYKGATLARVDPDGSVHVEATGLRFPNGTVITPDGKTLIIAETLGARLSAFDVNADGSLTKQRVWAEVPGVAPDGICLDAEGAVWVADAVSPRCIRVRAGGEVLEELETEQNCYACMLGGDDGRTLFMLTAAGSHPDIAAAAKTGKIVSTQVAVGHAGLP